MNIKDLASLLREGGAAGAGGAGFPSYAKLSEDADTIILNCAECEPILKLHRQVLEKYAFEITRALSVIADAVGADRVIIAVKKSYKGAVAAVSAAAADYKNFEIKFLPEVYPSGDEVVTIYETTGRVVPPGSIPITVGVTVFNVETVLNIYNLLEKNKPVTHKYVTIAGEVKTPKTVYAPIGITFKELIENCAGGMTISDYAIINGGPMMGGECGIYDTVTKTTNAVLVLPREHYIIQRKRADVKIDTKRAMSSCCQCRMCTDLCPRHLLGHPIEPSEFMHAASSGTIRDIEPMLNTAFCCGCGVCELYACGQGLSPRTMIVEYKNALRREGIKPPKSPKTAPVSKARSFRGVSKERLTARIGLAKYEVDSPLSDEGVTSSEYRVKLSQHIGAPSVAAVKTGEHVTAGQVIAKAAEGALSVSTHSPADGEVVAVTDKYIMIRQEGGK
ncbi:MAG: SLBB domain-containing protein [Clostridia bacterium]|nr:SLBB domain-containing protein [Clostridia bacterium]